MSVLNSESEYKFPWVLIIIGFIIYLAGFVTYGYFMWLLNTHQDAGLFGDMFGAINAFVSGLAFFGVILAIILQKRELELQRREIQQNREELSRQSSAQEKWHEALVNSTYSQAFKSAVDILQREEVRISRGILMSKYRGRGYDLNDDENRQDAERVCHTYDSVGQMVRYKMLPAEYIVNSWNDSLRRCWNILEPLIIHYRKERDHPELWDDFQYLAALAFGTHADEPP